MAARLTVQEVKVLLGLCDGLRNGQIATRLHISERTVANTLSAAYAKLGVNNRQDAVEEFRQNWSESGKKTGMVESAQVGPHSSVDTDQFADPQTGANRDGSSLYSWYRRLGKWRTPPRSAAFRTRVILGWILVGLSILLLGLAVARMLFGATDGFAPAANPF